FGVFTESTAANMAIPIKFAIEMLKKSGWKSPEELETEKNAQTQTASVDVNPPTSESKQQ
ncbi:MAG TPA: hypothetical protein PKY82_27600, partial [Pyrinomonadaceae bacterium]|nr:hypothetical protein [Pyrinomonadaceae bacterium]